MEVTVSLASLGDDILNSLKLLLKKLKRPGASQQLEAADPYALETPLLYLAPGDAWTIADACTGTQIFGGTGSGKTSGSGAALAKAFLRAGFGGLVLCAKPGERELFEEYAKTTGREKHLVVFSPEQPYRFNFLDYELRRDGKGGGQTENLVNLFSHITEIVEGKVELNGGDAFWPRAMRELLRNAIDLLAMAKGKITLEEICQLIATAPQSLQDTKVKDENGELTLGGWWDESFCAQCFKELEGKEITARQMHDLTIASNYWLKTYPTLSDRTKSGIVATFTGVADMLLHGFAWELFCTETNLVPEASYKEGAIIILDISIQEYHDLGRIAQGLFKFMWQRAMLRRDVKQYPRPVFLWADESQNFVSSFDFQYQAVARSAKACTVYLTQNISNYYSMLGSTGRDEANALLGNLQTQIFHANADQPTNQYAADLIAQEWTVALNFGSSAAENGSSHSGGGSQTVQYKLLPATFTTLRKGGMANNREVDAVIFQGGRIWQATQDTYLKTVFKQGS